MIIFTHLYNPFPTRLNRKFFSVIFFIFPSLPCPTHPAHSFNHPNKQMLDECTITPPIRTVSSVPLLSPSRFRTVDWRSALPCLQHQPTIQPTISTLFTFSSLQTNSKPAPITSFRNVPPVIPKQKERTGWRTVLTTSKMTQYAIHFLCDFWA